MPAINKSAAKRILGKPVSSVEEWDNVARVNGKFVSKKEFQKDFEELRQQGSADIEIEIPPGGENTAIAINKKKGTRYVLRKRNEWECSCPDYQAHGAGHRCKHIIKLHELLLRG